MPLILEPAPKLENSESTENVGFQFHHATRLSRFKDSLQSSKINHYNKTKSLRLQSRNHYKSYLEAEKTLFKSKYNGGALDDYLTVLEGRKSSRSYANEPLPLNSLMDHLALSYSMNQRPVNPGEPELSSRTITSPGARYSLEVYLYPLNVTELEQGLYHYNIKDPSLELISQDCSSDEIINLFPDMSPDTAVVYFVTSIPERITQKYGSRGYRFLYMEAGALGQSFSLATAALSLSGHLNCSCFDHRIEKICKINSLQEIFMFSYHMGIST